MNLIEEIKSCAKCSLAKGRKNAVPGEGSLSAELILVGEAPGKREDELGKPFAGSAGKILTELLDGIGLQREQVYITNIVKCRPPANRAPQSEEIAACKPYLLEQIARIKPKLVVLLGRSAALGLLNREVNLSKERGKIFKGAVDLPEQTFFLTYHPAACIYDRKLKRKLQEDFLRIKELI